MSELRREWLLKTASRIHRESLQIESGASVEQVELACRRTLTLMRAHTYLPELVEIIPNFHTHRERFEAINLVCRIVHHIELAYAAQDRTDEIEERLQLSTALQLIQERGVRDIDFQVAMVMPAGTGEIVMTQNIINRLAALG